MEQFLVGCAIGGVGAAIACLSALNAKHAKELDAVKTFAHQLAAETLAQYGDVATVDVPEQTDDEGNVMPAHQVTTIEFQEPFKTKSQALLRAIDNV